MTEKTLQEIEEEFHLAKMNVELCLMNKDSFTAEELKEASERYEKAEQEATKAVLRDFKQMPPDMQKVMAKMLLGSSEHSKEYWEEMLDVKFED